MEMGQSVVYEEPDFTQADNMAGTMSDSDAQQPPKIHTHIMYDID